MRIGLALTVLASCGTLAVATGCGGGTEGTKGQTGSTPASSFVRGAEPTPPTTAPTRDIDEFTWQVYYRPIFTTDPVKIDDYPENQILTNACESLMRLTPEQKLVPGLAEKVVHPDARTWVYTLRSGVRFWDGSPMTTADVVFSMRRHLDPKSGSSYTTPYKNVEAIDVTGEREITVRLEQPNVLWQPYMATPAGDVFSKAYVERSGSKFGTPTGGIMCTGPFQLTEWNGSQEVVLTRNDDYWDAARRPRAERIRFVFPQDPGTVANGMISGEIDGALYVPFSAVDRLQAATSAGRVIERPATSSMVDVSMVVGNLDGPLADARIRQALSLSIDREAFVQVAQNGHGTPLYVDAGPGTWGYARKAYDAAYQQVARDARQDLEKAKALIAEAGGPPAEPIVYGILATDAAQIRGAEVIQQEAAKVGLEIEIRTLSGDAVSALFTDPSARRSIDLFNTFNYPPTADPAAVYSFFTTPDGFYNFSGYSNPAVTRYLRTALRTPDAARRAALTIKAQAIVATERPWISLATPNLLVWQGKRITGLPQTFLAYAYGQWAVGVGAP